MLAGAEQLLAAEQLKMADQDFRLFAEYIYSKCGIKLSPLKKTMLTSRLNRRLRRLGIATFHEYYEYVTSPEGERNELVYMIDEVSTNKTDFFREPEHFEVITESILPEWEKRNRGRKFQIWSAGCSSGEEPYTMAMVLADYAAAHAGFDFVVTATDISTKVLAIAQRGVYGDDRLITVADHFKRKYLMKGQGKSAGHHKIVPELQEKIAFRRLNFLDDSFEVGKHPFDVIFCRNVIIYFDRQTQVGLFTKFFRHLVPGGCICIGHSETMPGLEDKFVRVAPAVYKSTRTA